MARGITAKQRSARKRNMAIARKSRTKGGKKKGGESELERRMKKIKASPSGGGGMKLKKLKYSSANLTRSMRG